MPVQVSNFPIVDYNLGNPLLEGFTQGSQLNTAALAREAAKQQMAEEAIKQKYLEPSLQEKLKQAQLQTQIMQPQAQYAPQMTLADLLYNQARTPNLQAQTDFTREQAKYYPQEMQGKIAEQQAEAQLAQEQAKLMGQSAPYLLAQKQGEVFQDPTLRRLFEYQQAQKTGAISPDMLSSIAGTGQSAPGANMAASGTPGKQSSSFQNWALFGSPYSPMQTAQMEEQAKTGVSEWNKGINAAADTSSDATQLKQNIDQFTEAYDKSTYKGTTGGLVPSRGTLAGIMSGAGADLSQEQMADNAAQNMQALMLKLLKTNRLTNYELQFVGGLKLGRNLDSQTVDTLSKFFTAKADRMNEYQDFLNSARDQGLSFQQANNQWTKYENDRPIFNFSTGKMNKDYKDSWGDYLPSGQAEESGETVSGGKTTESSDPLGIR